MDYEKVLEEQLDSMDMSELENIMNDTANKTGVFDLSLIHICVFY